MSPPTSLPTSLPTSNTFLESIFSTLSRSSGTQPESDASADFPTVSINAKPILLTLHALFPTILLPALDLLDRRLVIRLILQDSRPEQTTNDDDRNNRNNRRCVYYVKSNAQRDGRSRYSRGGGGSDVGVTSYEVRPNAWSCTCAAFAFSAFNNPGSLPIYEREDDVFEGYSRSEVTRHEEDEEMLDVPGRQEDIDRELGIWQWGGLMLGEEEMPLCKHLLACVLVERWDVAKGLVEEREVGREEMAGWVVGWGG